MIRSIMYVKMKDSVTQEQTARFEDCVHRSLEEIPVLTRSSFGRNTYDSNMPDGKPGPWTYVWDTAVEKREDLEVYRHHPYHEEVLVPMFSPASPEAMVEHLTFVHFEPEVFKCDNRETRPRKQQLAYQFRDNITPEQVKYFDDMMLEMPRSMTQMRNFCPGTAILRDDYGPNSPWHRIWEWEFMTDQDFDYYIDHKTHIDVLPFFDTVDPGGFVQRLTNAQYQLGNTLMTY